MGQAKRSNGRVPETLPPVQRNNSNPFVSLDSGKFSQEDRFKRHGVSSTTDLERYAKGVNLLSREGIERRAAFKTMKAHQRDKILTKAWSAVYNVQTSKQPFAEWYNTSGIRRPWPTDSDG